MPAIISGRINRIGNASSNIGRANRIGNTNNINKKHSAWLRIYVYKYLHNCLYEAFYLTSCLNEVYQYYKNNLMKVPRFIYITLRNLTRTGR